MGNDYHVFNPQDCEGWTGIKQFCSCGYVIAGLRGDGTVVAAGLPEWVDEIQTWDHILKLYSLAGDNKMIAGLHEDGRLIIRGEDTMPDGDNSTIYDVMETWENVRDMNVGVCAAGAYAVALHSDGSLSYVGIYDVGWSGRAEHIVDLDCSGWGLIALKADGTCVVNGEDSGYRVITDTWSDLKQVGCGDTLAVGLRNDGTIVSTRDDLSEEFYALRDIDHFECNTYNAITAYRADGTVEFFEHAAASANKTVHNWSDIDKIIITYPIVIGLKTDGTLVSTVGEINFG